MDHPRTLAMIYITEVFIKNIVGFFFENVGYLFELITITEKTRKNRFDIYLYIFI